MKLTPSAIKKDLHSHDTDMLVLSALEKDKKPVWPSELKSIPKALQEILQKNALLEKFEGKDGQMIMVQSAGHTNASFIVVLGLGAKDKLDTDSFRKAAGRAVKTAQTKGLKKLTLCLGDEVQAQAEGCLLAAYRFDKYKSENPNPWIVEKVEIMAEGKAKELEKSIEHAMAICEGTNLARDLVNEPPIVLTPSEFAKRTVKEANQAGLEVEVLDEKALEKERFGLLLAVGRAAGKSAPPRVVRLSYKPVKKASKHVVLVGKGVTFDSGGLDIKTAEGMLDMKVDMSGAAAVLGTMIAIAKIKPSCAVTGYLACVENGIGAMSYHPGDIFKSRKGFFVEIGNTDAEGRLILADTIDYALERDNPDVLVDLATLTGACMIALGPYTSGAFANQDKLANELIDAGKAAGEDFWRLPLNSALFEQLETPHADFKNNGLRYGGAITGALFIQKFINDKVAWAHLDIAGPAKYEKDTPYVPKGGTGFGVRTLVEWLTQVKIKK